MVPELGKPRVTEIQVRIDCNGCVQKIKKALHGINGIYDLYIDLPQQKLTIIGWADPEKIVKAIKKTRKIATICSHSEQPDPPAQPTEATPEQPAPDAANPPPTEASPEVTPPTEPPKDPPPAENPPPDATPSTAANEAAAHPSRTKEGEEVHVIYHHPPDYGYRYGPYGYGHSYGHRYGSTGYAGQRDNYPNGPGFRQEPSPPVYVTQSYNTYNPPPNVTHSYREPPPPVYVTQRYNTYNPPPIVTHSYNTYKPSPRVTEYEYVRSPPRYTHYSRPERYGDDYHCSNNGSGNISSIFSDENPNACRIV